MRGADRTLTKSEVRQSCSKRAGANGGRVDTHSPVGWKGETSGSEVAVRPVPARGCERMKDNRESRSFSAIFGVRHQSAGTGSSVSKIDWSGQVKFSLSRSSAKQLRPQADQRVTSLTTLGSVKLGKYCRSDSRTLLITVCRRAPGTFLFVRPVSRACAGPRKTCSAGLLVPGTGIVSPRGVSTAGAVTNVNNCLAAINRISSLQSKRYLSSGPSPGGSSAKRETPLHFSSDARGLGGNLAPDLFNSFLRDQFSPMSTVAEWTATSSARAANLARALKNPEGNGSLRIRRLVSLLPLSTEGGEPPEQPRLR